MASRPPSKSPSRRESGSFQKRGGYESSGPATSMKVPTKLPGAGAKAKANGSSPGAPMSPKR